MWTDFTWKKCNSRLSACCHLYKWGKGNLKIIGIFQSKIQMLDDEWQAPFDGAFDETTKSFPYGTLTAACLISCKDMDLTFKMAPLTLWTLGVVWALWLTWWRRKQSGPALGLTFLWSTWSWQKLPQKKAQRALMRDISGGWLPWIWLFMPAFGARDALSRGGEGDVSLPSAVSGLPYRHLVFYMYLIPKMFTPTFGVEVARLLEGGATFLVWHYFPDPQWPSLTLYDDKFKLQVYRRGWVLDPLTKPKAK